MVSGAVTRDLWFESVVGGELTGAEMVDVARGLSHIRGGPLLGERTGDSLGVVTAAEVKPDGVHVTGRIDGSSDPRVLDYVSRLRAGSLRCDLVGKRRDGVLAVRAARLGTTGAPARLVSNPALRPALKKIDLRVAKLGLRLAALNARQAARN